jgi:CheY-like chemotaxis protein
MKPGDQDAPRILIVDDDAGVRQVLRGMLLPAGYQVEAACNGREALDRVRQEHFDLIITDLVMPEQEGIETIKLLRQEFPAIKVIAISGAFGGDYLRIAAFLGASRTLAKPVRMETMIRAVEETLNSQLGPQRAAE